MAATPMNAATTPTLRPAAPSPGLCVGRLPVPVTVRVTVPVPLAEPDDPPPTVGGL